MGEEKAKVVVFRYNPEDDERPRYEAHEVPYQEGMTVLDALTYIRQNHDSTLAFSYECRCGYCGSCAVEVNGEPTLACRTLASKNMLIKPLSNVPIVRDLVVDRTTIMDGLVRIRPFLERRRPLEREPEELLPADFSTFRIVSRCINCLCCVSRCPTFTEARHLYAGPTLMVEVARLAFDPRDGGDRPRTAYEEGLFNCAMCGKCTEVCPHDIDVPKLVMMPMRRVTLERNIGPVEKVEDLRGLVKTTGKSFIKPLKPTFLSKVPSDVRVEKPRDQVGLFLGCLFDYDFRLHDVGESAINVLRSNQIETVIPKGQVCCGLPFILMGYMGPVKEHLLKQNLRAFRDFPKMITLCAGCINTLRNWYPLLCEELGEDYKIQVLDVSEFLLKRGLETDLMGELDLKVTYHDPCELNRNVGVSVEPRKVIQSIPGVQLVEMDEPDRCCGGNLKMLNPRLGYKIAGRKAKMVRKLDVDAVVTACPRCITQISSALQLERARGVRVLHVVQLLDMAYKGTGLNRPNRVLTSQTRNLNNGSRRGD